MTQAASFPTRTVDFSPFNVQDLQKAANEEKATNDKTQVVAGRILVGVGIVTGVVSIPATLLVSFGYLWGVALSVGCVALGNLLINDAEQTASASVAVPKRRSSSADGDDYSSDGTSGSYSVGRSETNAPFVPGQPSGIYREGNNCWANSLLQFMRHIPSIYNYIQDPSNPFGVLRNFYESYELAQAQGQTVARNANSQRVREWLSEGTTITRSSRRQEDASEALNYVLQHFHPHFLKFTGRTPRPGQLRVERDEEARAFLINVRGHAGRPLHDLFIQNYLEDNGETRRFYNKPSELIFQINRNASLYGKLNDDINVPEHFTLPDRTVLPRGGGGGNFELDAIIVHEGRSMNSGHYVAYLLINGQWWLCDDSHVRPASDAEMIKARSQASIVHYASV